MKCDKWIHLYSDRKGLKLICDEVADVRENVRGEWIDTTSGEHYKCSQCGTLAPIWIDESNSCEYDKDISEWLSDFCPNCGAQMIRGES